MVTGPNTSLPPLSNCDRAWATKLPAGGKTMPPSNLSGILSSYPPTQLALDVQESMLSF